VARVTLAAPLAPLAAPVEYTDSQDVAPADQLSVESIDRVLEPPALASRRDLHVARRLRRRDALLGLGVLATALGATVAVLDMLH
jgi:hypothetical protein